MFDVSFTELMVVGVVALIVIGPERLPRVAKTIGHLLGRAQRYVSDVKGDIRREIELDDLRKFKSEMDDAAQSVQSTLRETETSFRSHSDELRSVLDKTAQDAQAGLSGAKPASTLASAAVSATTATGATTLTAASDASSLPDSATAPASAAASASTALPASTAAPAAAPPPVSIASPAWSSESPASDAGQPTVQTEAPLSLATAAFGTSDTPSSEQPTTNVAPAEKPARANDWPPPPTWNKP